MKVGLLVSIFAIFSLLYADNDSASKAYETAEKYEQNGDTLEAVYWYKKSAKILMEQNETQKTKLEKALSDSSIIIDEERKAYINRYLDDYDDNQTRDTVFQSMSLAFGILPYKSNYILPATYDFRLGEDRKHFETLFQISLQKPFLKNVFGLNEMFLFAYTQRSWWQTSEESSPFRETNYSPEVYLSVPHMNKNSFIKSYQFGYLHESNGQGDFESRSWNRLYASVLFQFKGIFIYPRVWYRLKESAQKDDNPDILDYMGYGDLTIVYPYKEHIFKTVMRNNLNFNKNRGAIQLDWTFPLLKNGLFGYMQIFNGYGESLKDYDRKAQRISIGVAFSR